MDHFTKYGVKAIPAPLAPHLLINHATHTYDPVVFFNDFWMLRDRLVAMNESVQAVPMQLFLHTMAQWKWQLYMQVIHYWVLTCSDVCACKCVCVWGALCGALRDQLCGCPSHATPPQLQQSLDMQVTMGMSKEGETDELKKVFLEGNPFFLVRNLTHSGE